MCLQVIKWIGGCDYLVSLGVSTIAEIPPDACGIEKTLEVLQLAINRKCIRGLQSGFCRCIQCGVIKTPSAHKSGIPWQPTPVFSNVPRQSCACYRTDIGLFTNHLIMVGLTRPISPGISLGQRKHSRRSSMRGWRITGDMHNALETKPQTNTTFSRIIGFNSLKTKQKGQL